MKKFLSCVISLVMLLCSVACTDNDRLHAVQDIEKFVPAVTNVAKSVCAFAPSADICKNAATTVSADASVLVTALTNYFNAKATGEVPAGIISSLNLAITTFENDSANILDAVRVLDKSKQDEIFAIVAAASVLLAVVESVLPETNVALKFKATKPATFNLSAWTKEYNAQVAVLQDKLPRNVELQHIHVHAFPLHYIPGVQ